ncbi:MAG: hypothetical protein J0L89_05765 [Xanthomonadales bacterium]|nr:hypothetical protein [Xanthomonadales bacterium]
MDANMDRKDLKQRGTLWPLLFIALGMINIFDYFYKSTYQLQDLLQGVGFLLVVPLAYFVPAAFSFGSGASKPRASAWLNVMAVAGLALVSTGFALQWGWL